MTTASYSKLRFYGVVISILSIPLLCPYRVTTLVVGCNRSKSEGESNVRETMKVIDACGVYVRPALTYQQIESSMIGYNYIVQLPHIQSASAELMRAN